MSRAKEFGKTVEELSPDELRRERLRCRTLAKLCGNKGAGKALRKRLRKIEQRLENESTG